MNQLVEINLIFQWFDHCLNTLGYQIVKISQISREKILGKRCNVLIKESNFNVSEQLIFILKHSGLLKQRKF